MHFLSILMAGIGKKMLLVTRALQENAKLQKECLIGHMIEERTKKLPTRSLCRKMMRYDNAIEKSRTGLSSRASGH
jgi:hypothetical protein